MFSVITPEKANAPEPDWSGTAGAFVGLFLIALSLFGAGTVVWYLYLKRQYPGVKVFAAARIQWHEIIDDLRAKLHEIKSKSDNDPSGDGNSPESEVGTCASAFLNPHRDTL